MNTNPQSLTPQILPAPAQVTPEQANAWVGLAQQKNTVAFELQRQELAAQQILLPVQNSDKYADIDKALAEYRKAYTATVEIRKNFTAIIEANIIDPLMIVEKRLAYKATVNTPANPLYVSLEGRSLSLRKEESDKAALQNAKNSEIGSFKAHVQNEFSRVVAEYKGSIRKAMQQHYTLMLTDKVKDPSLDKVKEFIRQIAPPPVNKFHAKYLTHEELSEIFLSQPAPKYDEVYDDLVKELDKLFANYDNDLANSEAAIKHREEQAKLQALEEETKAKEEQAMNTLISKAETVTIDEPKIKRTVQVKVIESEQWAKAVMAAFITNLPNLAKYIRVKSWSKLNIGQMATYLSNYATDSGVTFSNLVLEEVEK